MLSFNHETLAQRVIFGSGQADEHLAAEVERLGAGRVMVVAAEAESAIARRVASKIDVALEYDDVAMHVPLDNAVRARQAAEDSGIDLVVSIGGGSTTGLAKAIALTTKLPIIAIPTTYAGSEATNVWGLTESARKKTGTDNAVLPVTVIYDAELTLSLPVEMSVASGLNGLAHCIDSMWGPNADPINQAFAAEGIRALNAGLPGIVTDPQGYDGREQALYGAYMSAVAFASAGSGMHHKICHMLGGTFNLPHAQTHAIVLPYVLAFNAPAAIDAEARIALAFGARTALEGIQELRMKLHAPKALADYGFTEDDIEQAVEVCLPTIPESNPRPVTRENLAALLRAALHGDDPAVLSDQDVEGVQL